MGMRQDVMQCMSLAQADDVKQHTLIEAACETIYVNNNMVNSKGVEKLLQEESLVPTAVHVSSFSLHCQC